MLIYSLLGRFWVIFCDYGLQPHKRPPSVRPDRYFKDVEQNNLKNATVRLALSRFYGFSKIISVKRFVPFGFRNPEDPSPFL